MNPSHAEKRGRYWFRLFALFFSLQIMAISVGSCPAQADPWTNGGMPVSDPSATANAVLRWEANNKDWIEALGYVGKIISGIAEVTATVTDWMTKIVNDLKLSTVVKSGAQQAELDAFTKFTKAEEDSATENVALGVLTELAADNAPSRNEVVCKSALSSLLPLMSLSDYSKEVSRFALSLIESRYLGSTADGSGPQFAADAFAARAKMNFCGPDYPSGCTDTSTTGTDGRKLFDADLSFFTLDGGLVLEMPKLKSKSINGITFSIPDPQNLEQRQWVAAVYVCFNVAGPRPTPPAGDNKTSPDGTPITAFWKTIATKESEFSKPCTDLVAYLTRPNSDASDLISKQKKDCLAAWYGGVDVSAFGNCTAGLSPFQAEKLELLKCKAHQYYLSYAQAGGDEPHMMKAIDECTQTWKEWDDYNETMRSAVTEGAIGLSMLRKQWSQVYQPGKSGQAEPAKDEASPKREAKAKKQAAPVNDPTEIRQIKTKPAQREMPKGIPVSADEMAWPEAVAQ